MKTHIWSSIVVALAVPLVLVQTGCLTISRNNFRGTAGASIRKSDVDFSFIKPGSTRRDEVTARLAAIDAGSPSEFFWGRWAEPSWHMVGAGPVSAQNPVGSYPELDWKFHNLLVKFDELGIVREKITLDDGERLWKKLLEYSRNSPGAASSEPLRIPSLDKKYPEIILSAASIEFRGSEAASSVVFQFPSPTVISLRPHFGKDARRPEWNCYSLQAENASAGTKRKANFCASGRTLAQVLGHIDHLPGPAQAGRLVVPGASR